MARILEALPEAHKSARVSKYPLDEWFDGQARELTHGEDFDSKPDSFRNAISGAGRARGIKVLTRKTGEKTVAIQAVANGMPPAKTPRQKDAQPKNAKKA